MVHNLEYYNLCRVFLFVSMVVTLFPLLVGTFWGTYFSNVYDRLCPEIFSLWNCLFDNIVKYFNYKLTFLVIKLFIRKLLKKVYLCPRTWVEWIGSYSVSRNQSTTFLFVVLLLLTVTSIIKIINKRFDKKNRALGQDPRWVLKLI